MRKAKFKVGDLVIPKSYTQLLKEEPTNDTDLKNYPKLGETYKIYSITEQKYYIVYWVVPDALNGMYEEDLELSPIMDSPLYKAIHE